MKITVLGSGTSTGVPMVGCNCRVCNSSDPRDRRSRASILLSAGGLNILVDTTTDLRSQMLRERIMSLDAVLFTHAHADHVNGIDDLRGFHFMTKRVLPCYGCSATMERLLRDFSYIFQRDAGGTHPALLDANVIEGPFELFGFMVKPVMLEHGPGTACGYRVGSFAYLSDCSAIPESSAALLEGVDTMIIDGLRWSSHPFHFNIEGAMAAARSLGVRRTILTHLTHEIMHSEGEHRLPDGVEFAWDGMSFEVQEL